MAKTRSIADKLNLAENAARNDIKKHSPRTKFNRDLDKIESVAGVMTTNNDLTAKIVGLINDRLECLDDPTTEFGYAQTKFDFHRLVKVLTAVRRSFCYEML